MLSSSRQNVRAAIFAGGCVLVVLLACHSKGVSALPMNTPGILANFPGGEIRVFNNVTMLPNSTIPTLSCFDTVQHCADDALILTALGTNSFCTNTIRCCPIAPGKKTIPLMAAFVTNNLESTSVLSDYQRCQCRPITYDALYLEDIGDGTFVTKTVPIHVGFQCDWSLNEVCLKFSC